MLRCVSLFFSLTVWLQNAYALDPLTPQDVDLPKLLKNGAVRVEREDGSTLLAYRESEPFIPASILKVATALCALENLTPDFRYETRFFSDDHGSLFIKGSGDPSLVSETLEVVATSLVPLMPRIERIVIDTSFFEDDIQIDGCAHSTNPYDAKNAAFVGNFSSAQVTHTKRGDVVSAEAQTPLTPRAREAGQRLPRGVTERVNLSSDWRAGVHYGGELLVAFLKKHGAVGAMRIEQGRVAAKIREVFTHRSPQTLQEILQSMLKFSTNFTANQIFLTLGAREFGAPATVEKGQRAMKHCLTSVVGWRDFHVEEGSGLSRRNQVTAQQMTTLLRKFEKYSFLLPDREGFIAKTGSLRGVNSLAGYFSAHGHASPLRFVVLINSDVPHLYKFAVAREIRDYINNEQIKHK